MDMDEVERKRRAEYNHPWARNGSKASASVGAERWMVESGVLIPSMHNIKTYCENVILGVEPSPLSVLEVEEFVNSPTYSWLEWAHTADNEEDSFVLSSDDLDSNFGSNKMKPVDILMMWRDAPRLARYWFSGDDSYQFVHEHSFDNQGVEEKRVGIVFYELLMDYSKDSNELVQMMVEEPTALLFSFFANGVKPTDSRFDDTLKILSHWGLPFSTFSSAMSMFRNVPKIALDAVMEDIAEYFWHGEEDAQEPYPDYVVDDNTMARFIYNCYVEYSRHEAVNHDDIPVERLIAFAGSGIFKPDVIKNCAENDVEPNIAAAMVGVIS